MSAAADAWPPESLLGRRVAGRAVRRYLASLGRVTESAPETEQGPEHFVAVRSAGLEVMPEAGVIQTVTAYREGHQGYGGYAGPLPLGLSLGMRRDAVRALLGPPQFSVESVDHPHLGRIGAIDRYDRPAFSTALDYQEGTVEILKIQILLPAAVPR